MGLPFAQTGPIPFWTCRPLALFLGIRHTEPTPACLSRPRPWLVAPLTPAFWTPVQRVPLEPLLFSKGLIFLMGGILVCVCVSHLAVSDSL